MAVDESQLGYHHPLYDVLLKAPGLSVATTSIDKLLAWGTSNAMWIFPMATSCCGIELMATAAARVDVDRMGTIVRAVPRQADVMVVAGTITVKMAPRIKRLWELMPEPKWCIAMGSCAISGDFYRDLYPVVPGIDTVLPVDIYVPGCPPNPESLMAGMLRLQELVRERRAGKAAPAPEAKPEVLGKTAPAIKRLGDPAREASTTEAQLTATLELDSLRATALLPGAETAADTTAAQPAASSAPATDVDTIITEHFAPGAPKTGTPPLVDAALHVELARRLKAMGYTQLVFVVATHWPAPAPKDGAAKGPDVFEVAYGLRSVGQGTRLAEWQVRVEEGVEVESIAPLFAGADWQEREQYDLLGVRFRGHPDLRRIMMPDDWQGHPLRRDYASDTACPPWR